MTQIYCCACERIVNALGVKGDVIYPHRKDLYELNFWKCPTCENFVGTHKGTVKPLGCIPTPELKEARKRIHAILDPMWRNKMFTRSELYKMLSDYSETGNYHTAEIRTLEEADRIFLYLLGLRNTALLRKLR